MNWREHLRIIAMLANGLFVLLLIGSKGWLMSMGLGVPLIACPLLAVFALTVKQGRRD